MSSLEQKLLAILKSRDVRQMRRRLPLTEETSLIDFSSNDYLSLSKCAEFRTAFLQKLQSTPEILGSGGSRLLINGSAHCDLENRLKRFLGARNHEALLFNSGFDANVGFFSCVPQPGDVVVHDEYIHASVHDGIRASRAAGVAFSHNSVPDLERVLIQLRDERAGLRRGDSSVFLAVESLYSMDGTVPPLAEMVQLAQAVFPSGNAHFVVDEAHSTGLYGPLGRGLVSLLGLEDRVYARLHTFGKSLASTGGVCPLPSIDLYGLTWCTAVMIVTPVVKDYLINYARSLIYTTSLSNSAIVQADCSFDILESGRAQKVSSPPLIGHNKN
jgi:8-amino-7-oxononanoate synthase